MKPKHNAGRHITAASPAVRSQNPTSRRSPALAAVLGLLTLLCLMGATAFAQTPWVRFELGQVRVTVPLNTTNSVVITNLVNVSTDNVSAVTFDVSNLPPGAGAILTDTNGNPLLSTTIDTNLWLTLNTTNIAEGVYTFYLNASGGATNRVPFVLQAAHVWNGANGAMEVTNLAWSGASNWFGGVPVPGSDVVFGDIGAQTNVFPTGFAFTNSIVDVSTTIGSLRFSQTGVSNAIAGDTNLPPRYHTLQINPAVTLTVSGTNGFSLMRDYIDERYALGVQLGLMGVNVVGGAGSKLVVSNDTANFGILLDNNTLSSLNLTNLQTFVANVSRAGIGEYQIYPNYRGLNDAFNGGRDTNQYSGLPRRFAANLLLARTNIIKATYKDPDNYTNENTRGYAIMQLNGEQYGNGSSQNTFFYLGASNAFLADSVCFIGASHATGNGGACSFATNNSVAWFRSTNGGRMSVFAVADDGGPNEGSSNVKATIDFSALNGLVDLLATNLYVARDRTLIRSNDNPTTEATLAMGRGTIDVNNAFIGFQEHSNKIDWTTIGGAQVYRGYCRGTLLVTNGGTFKVNQNLILGYTADTNPEISAQQYNTRGQITVYSNSTVMASNILVDSGLNFISLSQARANDITVNQGGNLFVTNGIGLAPGLPLDNLTIGQAGVINLFVTAGKTNINVRNLISSGSTPGIIKIRSLPSFPSYPTNIPIISYMSASPFLAADMSSIGGSVQGYIVNNAANATIDLFLTTNAPNQLTWVGNVNANWDLTTKNWVTTNNVSTNFTFGDIVTFNDNSTVTTVNIVDVVVPNQATNGVNITNNSKWYTFNAAGGAIAGTAKVVKSGANNLTFNAAETGPLTLLGGTLDGSGVLGVTTVASNAVLNFSGTLNGLTSTGTVTLATLGVINGAVSLQGGTFVNNGTVNTPNAGLTMTVTNTVITNNGTMNIGGSAWDVTLGSVLANFGTINNLNNRMNFAGLVFGTGGWQDPDGGLVSPVDGRVSANPLSLWSPGAAPDNSIASMYVGTRVDLNNTPGTAPFGIATLKIEVDFNNAQTNDMILADKWNNITGMILMTNINPGAGSFASGQIFQVFANNNGLSYSNSIDVNGSYPVMWPPVPAPGLQWNLMQFRAYGTIGVTNSPLVWNGTGGGTWDTNTANTPWQGPIAYTDNQGAVFDDSASGSTTVTLAGALAPGGYVLTTNIVGSVTNIYATGPAVSPGIVVSNAAKNYTFAGNGKITGITGLYKTGPGTLTLLTSNDFNGTVIVDGGTLAVSNTVVSSATIASLGLSGNNNEVIVDGATLKYIGTTNVNFANFLKANPNGATVEVASSTNEFNLNKIVFGPGAITKTGPGILILSQAGDTYAGGTVVNAGTLRLTASGLGFGGLTLNPNTALQITNGFNFTNDINVAGSPATIQVMGNATNVLGGAWTGSGSATLTSTGTVLFVLNGSMAGFSGSLSAGASTNTIRFNNTTNSATPPNTGSAAASFNLGTGAAILNNVSGQGLTYNLGALSGGPNTVLSGSVSNTPTPNSIYSIGANGSSTTFDGRIMDGNWGTVSVTKVGGGALLLNGANGFTGSLTVSNGTLGGRGSIAGNLIMRPATTLAPGTSVGTFTVGGTAALNGAVVLELNRLGTPLPNDRLSVAGAISASGTLLVTNIGPDLYNGSTFVLFNKAVSGFSSVSLPPTDPTSTKTYTWLNNIAANGSITLLSGGSTNPVPPTFTASYSGGVGGTLSMAWPYTNLGWTMYSNSVGLPETNMWFPIAGSGATNQISTTVDSNEPNVFFRLRLP
jgi:autotransporter-associated beta strand protein